MPGMGDNRHGTVKPPRQRAPVPVTRDPEHASRGARTVSPLFAPAPSALYTPPERLEFSLPTDSPAVPSLARERVEAWLSALRWPADEADDIVYAISELVTNTCEHAYAEGAGGVVGVALRVEHPDGRTRHIRVAVTDRGQWRPRQARRFNCGRGLALVRAMMADVRIRRGRAGSRGTAIVMTSPSVPS